MAIFNFIKNLISEKEGIKTYREKLAHFLNDAKLSNEEKEELNGLAKTYGLTSEELEKLQAAALSNVFKVLSSDQRITEEEKNALEILLNHFGIQPENIGFDQKTFNKYYSLALIDKGILPRIEKDNQDLNIIFKDKEVLHYSSAAVLRKFKRVANRINYGGLTGSFKIAKGIRYRVGSINFGVASKEVLSAEDGGIFYVTNQRIGFIGGRKQFSTPYNKIHSFELRPEGAFIFKEGKENPYILTLDDYEAPASIISFILNGQD